MGTEDRPDKPLELNIQAADQAVAFLENHRETQESFDRVAHLIQGGETPLCMELLSTVHWVMMREVSETVEKIVINPAIKQAAFPTQIS